MSPSLATRSNSASPAERSERADLPTRVRVRYVSLSPVRRWLSRAVVLVGVLGTHSAVADSPWLQPDVWPTSRPQSLLGETDLKYVTRLPPFGRRAAVATLSQLDPVACALPGTTFELDARVTFEPSGDVSKVELDSQSDAETSSCITRWLEAAHIPPFNGAAVTVKKHFVIVARTGSVAHPRALALERLRPANVVVRSFDFAKNREVETEDRTGEALRLEVARFVDAYSRPLRACIGARSSARIEFVARLYRKGKLVVVPRAGKDRVAECVRVVLGPVNLTPCRICSAQHFVRVLLTNAPAP